MIAELELLRGLRLQEEDDGDEDPEGKKEPEEDEGLEELGDMGDRDLYE